MFQVFTTEDSKAGGIATRLLTLALAVTVPLSLVACGSGSGGASLDGGSGGEDDGGDTGGGGGDTGGGGGDTGGGGGDTGGGSDADFDGYALLYGMNSSRVGSSYRSILFADAMMQASEFGEYTGSFVDLTKPVPAIPYGEGRLGEGWPDLTAVTPGTVPGARIFSGMEGSIPDGRTTPYVLEWSGTGTCRLVGTGVVSETNRASNRAEFFIDPTVKGNVDPGIAFVIDDSSASDPVRDVHIWLPGTEPTRPLFWQEHLDKVMAMNDGNGPYIWRSMDWTAVYNYGLEEGNGTFTFEFDSRVTPRSPSQATRKGMSVEMIVAYANTIQRDVILNVPHRTDQLTETEYAAFLADLFDRAANGSPAVPGINGGQPFAGLDPNLTFWIELSNEIWNPGYIVHSWMNKEAANKGISFEQQIAGEIAKMNSAAQAAFSAPGDDRLALYIGGHIIDPGSLQAILDALPVGTQVDAIGPAFYFSEQGSDVNSWLNGADQGSGNCPNCPTVEELIAAGRASIPILASYVAEHRRVADGYVNPDGSNPLLLLYEGGQHFVAGGFPWSSEVNAAQLHPDMYYAYVDDLIPTMVQEGVDIICWYAMFGDQDPAPVGALGPFGTWNTMDQQITLPVPSVYIDEQAPKAAAIYRTPPAKP